ncbi:MAG: molybdopterin-synthase adenylyltransferase MoeB [Chthoniobacterales bacterium]|nr:molybdopterin-synthase adenylyltransferase MoeB [Chthoniobacterales bacterium]
MKTELISRERLNTVSLSSDEIARYSRQLILPELALDGQRRLKAARVLCLGAGGLGSPAALYLAASGVGTLGLVDADRVDLSNLHRQILHGSSDVGRSKLESARTRIREANPHVEVELHEVRFSSANAASIVGEYDIVIDGSDNFPTRYLSNDVCVFAQKPNVYGSVFRFEGQASLFAPHLGAPCYRCLFPRPPGPGMAPSCAEAGVLGVVPGVIGLIQALETIKLITGIGDPLLGRLLHFDAERTSFRQFTLRRDPQCALCGEQPTITELIDYEQFCTTEEPLAASSDIPSITPRELKEKQQRGFAIALLDVREPYEHEIARIDGSRLIPLGEIFDRVQEIPREGDVVVYCKVGTRSAHAISELHGLGFTNLYNLVGGIDAWTDEIDPSLVKY